MNDSYAHELLDAAKNGDKEAAETIVKENSGLIWSIVRRYFGRGTESDDLYQIGCLGLLKAIKSYDAAFGTRFSTYAVPKIAGEIRRFLRDDGAVKVSRGLKERAFAVRSARMALEQRLGREPQLSELSEETGLTPEEIAAAENASAPTASLNRTGGEDGAALEDLLSDIGQEERLIEYVSLREAIAALPEKERTVIAFRYYRGLTQDDTAKLMKVSQVQISRMERKAVERLRGYLV
ncbi:MAG: sigma-70 family RNA polymerase sigma factor [Oscillospiraceae bacterium]|nr:sigma-70 family RNA polymerase sigma factor [Oscillospiraceae bacterium]